MIRSSEIRPNSGAAATGKESPSVSTRIVDPLEVPNWDAMVAGLPDVSFFHTLAWARVLEQSYGYKPVYFARLQEDRLLALLPMMEVKSWLTGRRGVSLPFTDMCKPLGEGAGELFEAVTDHGVKQGWKYWEMRGRMGPQSVSSASFYGHTLPLVGSEDKVFDTFDSSVRRAIRKGEKGNVTVDLGRSLDDMRVFYELHCKTRKKHGVPPQPFSFFANVHRHVVAQNQGFVMVARIEGRPISASVFVHAGTKAIYKYGASDEEYQALRPANMVMWRAIQWYLRAGFEELDLGRTDLDGEGLRRFKLNWGTTERRIDYCRYDLKQRKYMTGKNEGDGWSNRLVRLLPIPVARWVGIFLYRHVA